MPYEIYASWNWESGIFKVEFGRFTMNGMAQVEVRWRITVAFIDPDLSLNRQVSHAARIESRLVID